MQGSVPPAGERKEKKKKAFDHRDVIISQDARCVYL